MRRIFELGQAAMMREEQGARGATTPGAVATTAAAAAQLITPQQLAMNASSATVPPAGTDTEVSADSTADGSAAAAARRRTESPPKAAATDVEDTTPWPTQYFRPLSAQSALVQARLNGMALTTVFAGSVVVTPRPGEQLLSVARNCAAARLGCARHASTAGAMHVWERWCSPRC